MKIIQIGCVTILFVRKILLHTKKQCLRCRKVYIPENICCSTCGDTGLTQMLNEATRKISYYCETCVRAPRSVRTVPGMWVDPAE
jgi:lysyl-tRNA synthetase class I